LGLFGENGESMKITLVVLALFILCSCGSKESSPASGNTSNKLTQSQCLVTLEDANKLVGTYSDTTDMAAAVASWAVDMAAKNKCAVEPEKLGTDLDKYLFVKHNDAGTYNVIPKNLGEK
jgi:ABC-type phosphate transport system substrate-binding protein